MSDDLRNGCNLDMDGFSFMLDNASRIDWDLHDGVLLMREKGWSYEYIKGNIDNTGGYTRRDEDRIVFKNDKYLIQVNLASINVVIEDMSNSTSYYSFPTVFLGIAEIMAVRSILVDLDALRKCYVLSKKKNC